MSGFVPGASSLANLRGVHPRLVAVTLLAMYRSPVDFKVIEGVRTPERQLQLYAQGRTKPGPVVTWTKSSKHFINVATGWGHAVDLLPAPYDWKALEPFDQMGRAMLAAGEELGLKLRWGANWDGDGNWREKGETDSPHFEF